MHAQAKSWKAAPGRHTSKLSSGGEKPAGRAAAGVRADALCLKLHPSVELIENDSLTRCAQRSASASCSDGSETDR